MPWFSRVIVLDLLLTRSGISCKLKEVIITFFSPHCIPCQIHMNQMLSDSSMLPFFFFLLWSSQNSSLSLGKSFTRTKHSLTWKNRINATEIIKSHSALSSEISNPLCNNLNKLFKLSLHIYTLLNYVINMACTNTVCSKILITFVVITFNANYCHFFTSYLHSVAFSPHHQSRYKRFCARDDYTV